MRPLRSCDFCDADALGTFDVVPPELEPTEAERRRAVLCESCKQRLEVLLEPLLARASPAEGGDEPGSDGFPAGRTSNQQPDRTLTDDDSAGTAAEPNPSDAPGRDPRALEAVDPEPVDPEADEPEATDAEADQPGSVVASADESTEKRRQRRRPNASLTTPEERTGPDEAAGTDAGDDPSERARVDGADGTTEPDATGERTGITFDETAAGESGQGNAAGSTPVEPEGGRSGVVRADEPVEGDADESEASTDDVEQGDDTTSSTASHADPTDDGRTQSTVDRRTVAKVIRLLQNRDLPIERVAAEELAASAYDLEDHEAEAIVDRTLERGTFLEQGGELHRA
ncbi:hypothetical protein [Natrarchaeobaculum aegyptiacum]|uniref:Uncharacterized protein n=1 Tax=Natrarchaeobaculum aegyptiacum TaxID=745377 RepID=A0A2Z2HW80_9EURY|nr:hypothetical protein [Natrarchaeobaculum aegyptiacum]ARS89807.1 hypothetical protein B1756_08675 [Natrarchaeobaculum aegyptiacum]